MPSKLNYILNEFENLGTNGLNYWVTWPFLQVDMAVDVCSQLINLRQEIMDSKTRLDQYTENGNNKVRR